MLRQLERIGLGDSQAARKYLAEHLSKVAGDATNVVARQANGRVVRESLLMGPRGALKVESIWEGGKLITVKLIGGGN